MFYATLGLIGDDDRSRILEDLAQDTPKGVSGWVDVFECARVSVHMTTLSPFSLFPCVCARAFACPHRQNVETSSGVLERTLWGSSGGVRGGLASVSCCRTWWWLGAGDKCKRHGSDLTPPPTPTSSSSPPAPFPAESILTNN